MSDQPSYDDRDGHERVPHSRFRAIEARYRNTGAGTRSVLFALAASLVLGALIMFYHRDSSVVIRPPSDANTGQIVPGDLPHRK
jgi:hypothetical protein